MGKDSLTKSTTKKKTTAKKKKTTAAQTAAKTAAKKVAAPSLGELLHKKFDRREPESLYQPPVSASRGDFNSPPFIDTDNPETAKRIRALLFKKYSLADLAAAAKAEEEARLKAEAEAAAKAEEEARLKAEAEAKAKAEAEARQKAEAEAEAKAEEEARLKAEAEAKAKAEEEARITAEAEKLAAERAAARKAAAASEPRVSVTYGDNKKTPLSTRWATVDKTVSWPMIAMAGGIALLFVLIIGASLANSSKYYLKSTSQGLEIHQGKFAPLGTRQILFLPGVAGPETPAPVYRRADVMPFAVQHFLARADARLAEASVPDYPQVKAPLEKAMAYATSPDEKQLIQARLDAIDQAMLIYKAQISAARQTLEGYDEAIDAYREALRLADDDVDIQAIETRLAAVETARADLKTRMAEAAAAQKAADEEAAAAENEKTD
jgi:colicin import membrane protein